MIRGFYTHAGVTYAWRLADTCAGPRLSFGLGPEQWHTERCQGGTWRVSRTRLGRTEAFVFTLPEEEREAPPDPVMPFWGAKRKAVFAHQVTR